MIAPLPPGPGVFPITRQLAAFADVHVMPETHLIYAATWFTLAVCGAAIVYGRFGRRAAGGRGARRSLAAAQRRTQ